QRWKSQLRAEQGARMASLQARIRPHFLFNTLNTIASLVRTRPDDAEQAVLDLSDLLRSGLRDESWHTLADELELVRGYLRIESLRLGERLRIDWQLSDALPVDDELPALLIQPLVENAIMHGIARLPEGGELKIAGRADRGGKWSFVVENPVPTDDDPNGGDGARMALDNIRQRLELAWEGQAQLITNQGDGRFRAELRFPGGAMP
ncbi:MAG: histidine kinase, partial [Wenzhouxiangellaceae bacterium]|nr:histidine kinase [Wenzhouxiangellaceae bacterium]